MIKAALLESFRDLLNDHIKESEPRVNILMGGDTVWMIIYGMSPSSSRRGAVYLHRKFAILQESADWVQELPHRSQAEYCWKSTTNSVSLHTAHEIFIYLLTLGASKFMIFCVRYNLWSRLKYLWATIDSSLTALTIRCVCRIQSGCIYFV